MAERDAGGVRYTGFLSYSHKDAAVARWLHRKLETYRIPRRLVGTPGEQGPVPARLTPIFRDREELPAAGDLSEKVRAALAASDNLVVVCSPHSAASPWVAKEIDAFRELHPDRPVFAAIVEGDPDQCFPQGLTAAGAEPLAADLRREGDGRRLGLLKLVAGLAGVPLDALAQRDAQRRVRRVTAVTAAALAGVLLMAVLTLFAFDARQEAQRQRAEAEGLVEFMLTELRTKLKGVGSIETMQTVNRRALQYYGGGDELGGLRAESLLRRARILRAIGEDLVKRGDMAAALLAFREAHRVTGEQLARRPDDPQLQLEHGRSDYWIGHVHELRDEWLAAAPYYARFAAVAQRLLATAPADPDYLLAAASAAIDVGNVHLKGSRDIPAAQRSYEKAVGWAAQATRVRPGDPAPQIKLADAYAYLADSFYARKMWRESLAARLRQHSIVERLHRSEPANRDFAWRFALAQRAVGSSAALTGDKAGARPALFGAYQSSGDLVRRDPDNAEWLLFRGMMGCELLFRGLGLPAGVSRGSVEAVVRSVGAALEAQHNPRLSELDRCLTAIG